MPAAQAAEAFGRFDYESGDGRNRAVGSFTEGADPTHRPIEGHFSDEDTWSLEADLQTNRSTRDRWAFPVSLGAVCHFG